VKCGSGLPAELVNITPTSLTTGYGTEVCTVLRFLTDAALQVVRYEAKPLVHYQSAAVIESACRSRSNSRNGMESEDEEDEVEESGFDEV
jgi:hypothetical protein